jgi:hypothetical protein
MGRADIPLKAISYWLILMWVAWTATTIAISCLSDAPTTPAFLGPLQRNADLNMLHYGVDTVLTFVAVLGCWMASYNQTRQLRAMALVMMTIVVFGWLISARSVFYGLAPGYDCGAGTFFSNGGPIPGPGDATRFCSVMLAAGIISVLFEFGKVLLWGWSIFRFIQLRHLEPFCELDKS